MHMKQKEAYFTKNDAFRSSIELKKKNRSLDHRKENKNYISRENEKIKMIIQNRDVLEDCDLENISDNRNFEVGTLN